MKARNLALAGTAALLLGANAHADFKRLVAVLDHTWDDTGGTTGLVWDMYNIFAEFDNTTDALLSLVGQQPIGPLVITTDSPAGYYNNPVTSDIEHNRTLDFPGTGIGEDSYFTIGAYDTQEPGYPGATGLTPFFDAQIAGFNAGSPTINITDGAWFRLPSDPWTRASHVGPAPGDGPHRVLAMVLTVQQGSNPMTSAVGNLQWHDTVLDQFFVLEQIDLLRAPGACCINGACVKVLETDCVEIDGTFQGVGSWCGDVTCPVPTPTGGCCIDGNCVVLTEPVCTLLRGEYQGDDVACIDVTCGPPCWGDANGDGVINTDDFLAVLEGWGTCP